MRLTAICVGVVLAQVLMVHGDCKGKCNIVYCGQSTGPRDLRYVNHVANMLELACYRRHETKGTCHSKDDCNLGTVFYKFLNCSATPSYDTEENDAQVVQHNLAGHVLMAIRKNSVSDKDVCAMSPPVDHDAKKKCIKTARKNQDDSVVTDNKLELCFQQANNDPGLMEIVDSECTYTVVVVARNELTNSDVTTLKAEAQKLKDNGAKIRCYVVGDSATYDKNYDDICDDVTKFNEYEELRRGPGSLFERVYDDIKCCPGDN